MVDLAVKADRSAPAVFALFIDAFPAARVVCIQLPAGDPLYPVSFLFLCSRSFSGPPFVPAGFTAFCQPLSEGILLADHPVSAVAAAEPVGIPPLCSRNRPDGCQASEAQSGKVSCKPGEHLFPVTAAALCMPVFQMGFFNGFPISAVAQAVPIGMARVTPAVFSKHRQIAESPSC